MFSKDLSSVFERSNNPLGYTPSSLTKLLKFPLPFELDLLPLNVISTLLNIFILDNPALLYCSLSALFFLEISCTLNPKTGTSSSESNPEELLLLLLIFLKYLDFTTSVLIPSSFSIIFWRAKANFKGKADLFKPISFTILRVLILSSLKTVSFIFLAIAVLTLIKASNTFCCSSSGKGLPVSFEKPIIDL